MSAVPPELFQRKRGKSQPFHPPRRTFYGRSRAVEGGKYQPALDVMTQRRRSTHETWNLDGDQLYLKAMADTESRQKTASGDAHQEGPTPAFADLKTRYRGQVPGVQRYNRAIPADSLSKIAKHFYGERAEVSQSSPVPNEHREFPI